MAKEALTKRTGNLLNNDNPVPSSGLSNASSISKLPGTRGSSGIATQMRANKRAPIDSEAGNVKGKNESQYSKVNDLVEQGGKSPGLGSGA